MPFYSKSLTRRTMLAHVASATAFGIAASSISPLFASSGSRRFKIGACDWSLGHRYDPASFDVAKQIGLDGVQVDMGSSGEDGNDLHLRRPDVQKAYYRASQQTGVAIASVAICEMGSAPMERDPRGAEWLSDSIDVCNALGTKVAMGTCFGLDMNDSTSVDRFVGALKEIAPKAEKQDVEIGWENFLSAEDNMRLIDLVGSPAVKVYYDVGNSFNRDRDILKEIRTLGKRDLICEFHFKDENFRLGRGRIDFREVRRALDDIEYSGWIQIETPVTTELVADYRADLAYLKTLFPENA